MAKINITQRDTVPGTKYPLQKINFQKPDLQGKMHEQANEVYFRPDGVAILLADANEKTFLLVRQFRLATFLNGNEKGYLIEACAGIIDEDETPEQAARREVEEETGYQIDNLEKVTGVYSSAGGLTEYVHLFIATYSRKGEHKQGGGNPGEGEDIEVLELTFEDAKEKLKQGAIRDAKTMLLLQHYLMNNV